MADTNEQLSDKELAFGYWWVTHRLQAKAALLVLAIIAIVALYANAGWRFYLYLRGSADYQAMLEELSRSNINYQLIHAKTAAQPLLLSTPRAVGDRIRGYDLVTEVENINQRWWLRNIIYRYQVNGQYTDPVRSFILPGEKKYLAVFHVTSTVSLSDISLELVDQSWQRITDPALLTANRSWLRPGVEVKDVRLASIQTPLKRTSVTFDVFNGSPFNFWTVEAQVLLWQGNTLVGFNTLVLDDVRAQGTTSATVYWNEDLPAGLRAEVLLSANNLNEGNLRQLIDTDGNYIR